MVLIHETEARRRDVLDVSDVVSMLRLAAEWLIRDEEQLTELDRAIGDGDHGQNMRIGFLAVTDELDALRAREPDLGTLLCHVGLTLLSAVGGASGPLYGAAFTEAGLALTGKREVGLPELAEALTAGCRGVARRGHCYPGDKTLLDTLQPASDALRTALASGASLGHALDQMREAAHQGMLSTTPLVARCGLAMRYGPRSAGHQDPGATSCYLLLSALATAWLENHP
jgi:dihydroxyacetone kinase-like protein